MNKIIGILGGMGPEATSHLFAMMVKMTEAERDQDHIHIVIDNNPKIPDRSSYLLYGGESPLPSLIESAQRLEQAGADFIIMPCHTAHFFYDEIVTHIRIPFLHLQKETLHHVEKTFPNIHRLGLLATTGTVKKELFQSLFKPRGEVISPDPGYQDTVMQALYGEKGAKSSYKNEPRRILLNVANHLKEKKADALIAGCTEVSLLLYGQTLPLPLIDPLKIIAEISIKKAGYRCIIV